MIDLDFYNPDFVPDFYWQSKKWLAYVLNQPVEQILTIKTEDLESNIKQKFKIGNQLLKQGYPLDYLLGQVVFCGQSFIITPNVLIPRPETEQWVAKLCNDFQSKPEIKKMLLVDIATGSGVIGISLSSFFKKTILSDISKQAMGVCKQNIAKNEKNKNIKTIIADGLPLKILEKNHLDWVLTANLPYLPSKSNGQSEFGQNLKFEPKIALYSGLDGLDCYNQVISQIQKTTKKPTQVYFELDPRNIQKADTKLQKQGYQTEIWKDFNGLERLLVGKFP